MPDDSEVPAKPVRSYPFSVPANPRLSSAFDDLDAHFAVEGLKAEIGVACGMAMISAHDPDESPVAWEAAADRGDDLLATATATGCPTTGCWCSARRRLPDSVGSSRRLPGRRSWVAGSQEPIGWAQCPVDQNSLSRSMAWSRDSAAMSLSDSPTSCLS